MKVCQNLRILLTVKIKKKKTDFFSDLQILGAPLGCTNYLTYKRVCQNRIRLPTDSAHFVSFPQNTRVNK